jgi:tetratricopeptide (TPR) repeat protein
VQPERRPPSSAQTSRVEPLPAPDRLDSWKEIAAYLNRSERTVRRWEDKEELPVHRLQHDKRGSVYAYTRELDAWRVSRRVVVEATADESPSKRLRPVWWVAATLFLAAAVVLVGLRVRAADAKVAERGTTNDEAWRLFELARFGDNAGRVQIETGIRYYRQAVELDPKFARAWAGLATAHMALTWFGEHTLADTMTDARRYAEQARQLDPSLSGGWRVLGFVSHFLDWNHAEAERNFRRAIELNPKDRAAQSWYGDFLVDMRRFDEARAAYNRSHDADPRWLEPLIFAANIYTFTGKPTMAIPEQRRTLESEPNYGLGIHYLGRAYLASRDWQMAIEHLRKSNEIIGAVPFTLGDLGFALAVSGQRDEATRMRDDLIARRGRGYYPAFPIAEIEVGLGNTDSALDWLERAVDERNTGFYFPSVDPVWDAIRPTPRFRALMTRMHLPS